MSLSIKTDHINYVAKVVKLDLLKPHPNADKIQLAVIDFQNVITSLDAQLGDLYVFFPVESQINTEFMSFINGYANKELNQDPETKGYFDKNARVKCQKFRGLPSEGYIHPIKSINAWLQSKGCSYLLSEKDVGTEFDTIEDITLCKKYIIKTGRKSKEQRQLSGECRVADGQFHLHTETAQLKRNLSKINPEDYISISYKMHGCLDRETVLQTKDHGLLTIGEIVEQQIKCEVLSRDLNKGEDVYSPVDDFHLQEDTDDWYEVELEDGTVLEVTGNHPIWLPDCEYYGKVENLKEGDFVLKC